MTEHNNLAGLGVCWLGGTRYTNPLNPTIDHKWRAMSALGINMVIIGFATGSRPRRFTQYAHFYLMPELPASLLRYLEMFLVAPWILLWAVFRHDIRVIIAQSPFEGAVGAFVKNICRIFGKRVALVVENHGDFEAGIFTQRQIALSGLYRWFGGCSPRSLRLSPRGRLRAVSSSTDGRWNAGRRGNPLNKFAWVDVAAGCQREKPLSSDDLVCAVSSSPVKGLHPAGAFAQVAGDRPGAHLWLVGKPENLEYAAQLHQQVERLGLAERVTFVGAVPQRELAGYMARARGLVLVSSSEGLPRVVIEAMLGGLVVIASAVSGIPDVVQDGVTGYLVPPEDVPALVQALQALFDNPTIDEMGTQAAAFARQFFSSEAYVEGHRRLIEAAIEN
ncbi:MAG: glycosyltransferase [Anaerolineaceae bacterium]|nr:glycosyltransferase [Anaerolineaceae bacterium]